MTQDPVLHRLPVAVELLELRREEPGLVRVLAEHELESQIRPAEPSCGIYARREAEPDSSGVDRGGVDSRRLHERLQAGPSRAGERREARRRERAVLVHERDDVGDGRQSDEVEVLSERWVLRAEERLAELEDHTRPAELRKGIRGGPRRHDRAVRERVAGAVMVGDDDLETSSRRLGDLVDGGDPAVDGEHEAEAVVREPPDRLARHAVALLEPARQVPRDLPAELPDEEHRESRGADPVDVVVAVHADASARLDRRPDPLHCNRHVAEEQRVVAGELRVEEPAGSGGAVVTAPDEDGRRHLGDTQVSRERGRLARVDRRDRPRSRHEKDGTERAGRWPSSRGSPPSVYCDYSSRRRRMES